MKRTERRRSSRDTDQARSTSAVGIATAICVLLLVPACGQSAQQAQVVVAGQQINDQDPIEVPLQDPDGDCGDKSGQMCDDNSDDPSEATRGPVCFFHSYIDNSDNTGIDPEKLFVLYWAGTSSDDSVAIARTVDGDSGDWVVQAQAEGTLGELVDPWVAGEVAYFMEVRHSSGPPDAEQSCIKIEYHPYPISQPIPEDETKDPELLREDEDYQWDDQWDDQFGSDREVWDGYETEDGKFIEFPAPER